MKDSDKITVCDNCLQASCWHGEFMCDEAYVSGTVEKTVGELRKLNYEHEHHWENQLRLYEPCTS